MTDAEVAEKLAYLRNSAVVYCNLAEGIADDHHRRIIARGVLVALDSFLKIAPQLKNRLPNTTQDEKQHRKVPKYKNPTPRLLDYVVWQYQRQQAT